MADQNLWRKKLEETEGLEDFQGKMADEWDGEIPLKPIVWSTVAIAVAVFVAFVFNIWLMEAWDGFRASKVRVSPLAEAQMRFEHVDPKLQPSPEAEMAAMKEEQNEQLASYGWIDPIERRVHIPVERAMEIVVDEKGGDVPRPAIEPSQDEPVDVEAAADEPAAAEIQGDGEPAAHGESDDHGSAGDQ